MKPYQNWDIIQYQLVRRMYFINFHQQCDDEKNPKKKKHHHFTHMIRLLIKIILIPNGEALLDGWMINPPL